MSRSHPLSSPLSISTFQSPLSSHLPWEETISHGPLFLPALITCISHRKCQQVHNWNHLYYQNSLLFLHSSKLHHYSFFSPGQKLNVIPKYFLSLTSHREFFTQLILSPKYLSNPSFPSSCYYPSWAPDHNLCGLPQQIFKWFPYFQSCLAPGNSPDCRKIDLSKIQIWWC